VPDGQNCGCCSDFIRLQLRGQKLANKDGLFGKSDPFFVFAKVCGEEGDGAERGHCRRKVDSTGCIFLRRAMSQSIFAQSLVLTTLVVVLLRAAPPAQVREDGSRVRVYESEKVMNNLNPTWGRSVISVRTICNGESCLYNPVRCISWLLRGCGRFGGDEVARAALHMRPPHE
jgi:hypothetical protein